MPFSVHMLQGFDDTWLKRFRAKLDDSIDLTHGDLPDHAEFRALIAGVPDEAALRVSPNLESLIIPWAGLPKKTRDLMLNYPDIKIYNIHHNAGPAAEMAITLLLAAAKRLLTIDSSLRNHDWRLRYDLDGSVPGSPQLLAGKTALILGYGAIGRRISRMCRAFDMDVIALNRSGRAVIDDDIRIEPVSRLQKLLPSANAVIIALPWTSETDNLLGRSELGLLADNSIIVNIARGFIIEEKALYDELASGRLYAGSDVWYCYPKDESERRHTPPGNFPFHKCKNMVMTPHLGGHSDRTEALRIDHLAEVVNILADGGQPSSRVHLDRGY